MCLRKEEKKKSQECKIKFSKSTSETSLSQATPSESVRKLIYKTSLLSTPHCIKSSIDINFLSGDWAID